MTLLQTGPAPQRARSRALASFERIAVVGATGLVGAEALSILHGRGIEPGRVIAAASERSAGNEVCFGASALKLVEGNAECLRRADLALLCASAEVSRELSPALISAGVTVVDNSSAFRMDPSVPLVISEVNGEALRGAPLLVANPNCSTIILLTALEPLRRAFGVESIEVTTYQAVSGAGAAAVEELIEQARDFAASRPLRASVFAEPALFNVFSHDSAVDPATGLIGEEAKIIAESRRIWVDRSLPISPTCVRVPTLRAHAQSVRVRLTRPATETGVRHALRETPGLEIVDDRAANRFPTPARASGRDAVQVGRIRPDPATGCGSDERCKAFQMFVCGDQLRKGAALNAVQIAEALDEARAGRLAP